MEGVLDDNNETCYENMIGIWAGYGASFLGIVSRVKFENWLALWIESACYT